MELKNLLSFKNFDIKNKIKSNKKISKDILNEVIGNTEDIHHIELNFLIDQLSNSMEFYDENEFANHIGDQTNLNKNTLKSIFNDYWDKLSPYDRNSLTFDWEEWLEDNYDLYGINESVKEIDSNVESDNLFGFAAVKDQTIKKIGSFTSFTKMINPKTHRERPVLNAGVFIDNDKVKGYINRIEGNKVFVESIENPGEIVELSIKDAIKVEKEEKKHTVIKKIEENI